MDESGDLGWKFDDPYRHGGSSRYLTIASLLTPDDRRNPPKRLIRDLYKDREWKASKEKKWADMGPAARFDFSERAAALEVKEDGIKYFAITVKKENVREHIRSDPNKLYNYMIKLSLAKEMSNWDSITFVPDPRTIKVASGNSLHDYLITTLWFDLEVKTTLQTCPAESSSSKAIQFADMLSGLVWSHHEDGASDPWRCLGPHITAKQLYFR